MPGDLIDRFSERVKCSTTFDELQEALYSLDVQLENHRILPMRLAISQIFPGGYKLYQDGREDPHEMFFFTVQNEEPPLERMKAFLLKEIVKSLKTI